MLLRLLLTVFLQIPLDISYRLVYFSCSGDGFMNKGYIKNLFVFLGGVVMLGVLLTFPTINKAYASCSTPPPTTAAGYQDLLRGSVNGKLYHGDLGKSVALPNGKILWVFGDTLIGTSGATKLTVGIHNSGLLTENGCISAVTGPLDANGNETTWVTPNATTDVPNLDDYYWASTPFMDGSTLRMFLSHMYNDAYGFHNIGVDLASFDVSSGTPVLQSVVQTPGSANGNTAPSWGASVLRNGYYTYIFGTVYTNTPWVWGNDYYLARVQNGRITNQSRWRYWNGSSWVSNQSAAAKVIDGTAGVGPGATVYRKSNGQYVIITKKFDMIGSDIVAFTASNLTGPWTEVTPSLMTIPALNPPMSSSDYTYMGLGHPEITLGSGNLLVNWSVGSSDFSAFGDPQAGVYFGEVSQP